MSKGALAEGVFKGETINTPSMLAVEDAIFALEWAKSVGGLHGLIARSDANAHALSRYAALCQEANIVPIVEPEVLYEGDHSIDTAARTTGEALKVLFEMLELLKVDLSGLILKTSMVLAGTQNTMSTPQEVADYTLKVLNKSVPRAVGGIVFLSGGQSPEQASANLNAIGQSGHQPWPITYSFSRAVQDPVMKLWKGKATNTKKAQTKFIQLLAQNSAARNGEYTS